MGAVKLESALHPSTLWEKEALTGDDSFGHGSYMVLAVW